MAEREILTTETVAYEGLFSVKDLIRLARDWAARKGYGVLEKKHEETVLPEGKTIAAEFEIAKRLTDYARSILKVAYSMKNLSEKVVERAGKKEKLSHGRVEITFEGVLETDWEKRWEVKPAFYLIRKFFEQYVYSSVISKFKSEIIEDLRFLELV